MASKRSSGVCILRPGASATRPGGSSTERSLGTSGWGGLVGLISLVGVPSPISSVASFYAYGWHPWCALARLGCCGVYRGTRDYSDIRDGGERAE